MPFVDFARQIQRIATDMADGDVHHGKIADEILNLIVSAGSSALQATTQAVVNDVDVSGIAPDKERLEAIERELKLKQVQLEKMTAQVNSTKLLNIQQETRQAQQKDYVDKAITVLKELINEDGVFTSDATKKHATMMMDVAFEPIAKPNAFSADTENTSKMDSSSGVTDAKSDPVEKFRDLLKILRPRPSRQ